MLRNQTRSYRTWGHGRGALWLAAALALMALLGIMSLVACSSSPEDTRTNTFEVGSSPAVDVEVGNGDVEVVVGAAGDITVTAELHDTDKIEYEVSQDGDTITVRAKTKPGSRADLTLTVPQNCAFVLATGNGNVEAGGLQASGQVNSGNGPITLEGIRGDVQANLGNGHITLDDVQGSFMLNAGNGGIVLREAQGFFLLNIGNGDVNFQGELTSGGENLITAGSGSVVVEVAGTPSVALDLETDDGEVASELPVDVTESSKYRLVGTIGDADAALTVRVGHGDITIK